MISEIISQPDTSGYLGLLAVGPREERTVAQEDSKQDEAVEWLTSDTEVGGQKVTASRDDPRYLGEVENGGKEAGHRPDALTKV